MIKGFLLNYVLFFVPEWGGFKDSWETQDTSSGGVTTVDRLRHVGLNVSAALGSSPVKFATPPEGVLEFTMPATPP